MPGQLDAVVRRTGLLVGVGAAYYLGARLGLQLSLVEHNVTPLWPPTGIAVAALLLLGRSLWPAVLVAAFLVNLPISANVLAAGVTAVGNVLAPVVAVELLRRAGFRRQIDRQRDGTLVVGVALVSMLVSATVGSLTLVAAGSIPADGFLGAWAVWWTGDTMGVLVVAPFLLSVPLFWQLRRWGPGQWLEATVIVLVIAVIARAGMSAELPVLFPVLPVLGWAAWRLQLRGAAPAALVASVATTWSATHGIGLFARGSLFEQMLTLQGFNACVALMSFFLAALVTERNSTAQSLLSEADARSRREHEIAVALQRTLLPESLPGVPGVEVAARYIPASSDMQVGGDWYDVLPLPDGRIALAIGDVAGHGLSAAATMGQLRMAVRAYALQDPDPASVMAGLQQLALQRPAATMTTLLYLLLDPESGRVRYANAGHPPALAVVDEQAAFLGEPGSPPLGVATSATPLTQSLQLAPGATLLLYTDGLVERRGESIDDGLGRLQERSQALAWTGLEELCDGLLKELLGDDPVADDVALLALRTARLDGSPLRIAVAAEPEVLAQVRGVVRRWLSEAGVPEGAANEILVACAEACNNVVVHAYGAAPGLLEVELTRAAGEIVVRVCDHGEWRPEADRGGGWGMDLTEALMDSVEVRRRADGTEVVMRRAAGTGGTG